MKFAQNTLEQIPEICPKVGSCMKLKGEFMDFKSQHITLKSADFRSLQEGLQVKDKDFSRVDGPLARRRELWVGRFLRTEDLDAKTSLHNWKFSRFRVITKPVFTAAALTDFFPSQSQSTLGNRRFESKMGGGAQNHPRARLVGPLHDL